MITARVFSPLQLSYLMASEMLKCTRCHNKNLLVECKCGCHKLLFFRDKWSRKVFYKHGHIRGSSHSNWKGDNVNYKSLHQWINRNLPKPDECPNCGSTKRIDACNISGNYTRNFDDWEYLCHKCHFNKYHSDVSQYIIEYNNKKK